MWEVHRPLIYPNYYSHRSYYINIIILYILALLNPYKKSVWFFPEQDLLPDELENALPSSVSEIPWTEALEMPPYPPTEGIGIVILLLFTVNMSAKPFQSASSKPNPDLQVIEVGIILSTSALGKFQKFLRKQIGHTDTCLLRHKGARRRHRIHKQSKHSTESTASVAVFAGCAASHFWSFCKSSFLETLLDEPLPTERIGLGA